MIKLHLLKRYGKHFLLPNHEGHLLGKLVPFVGVSQQPDSFLIIICRFDANKFYEQIFVKAAIKHLWT